MNTMNPSCSFIPLPWYIYISLLTAESIQALDTFYVDVYAVKSTSRISYDDDEQRYRNIHSHPLNILSITTLHPPCCPFPSLLFLFCSNYRFYNRVQLFQTGKLRTKEDNHTAEPCLLQNGIPFIPSFLFFLSVFSCHIYIYVSYSTLYYYYYCSDLYWNNRESGSFSVAFPIIYSS